MAGLPKKRAISPRATNRTLLQRVGDPVPQRRRSDSLRGGEGRSASRLSVMPDTSTARQRGGPPHHGTIVAVRGSVVDAHFPPPLPPLNNRLLAGEDNLVVIEVASHVDAAAVRGVALTATRGLARGAPVTDTGGPLSVPVGEGVLGRMLNVFGEALDDQPLPEGLHRRSIHRAPVPLARREVR